MVMNRQKQNDYKEFMNDKKIELLKEEFRSALKKWPNKKRVEKKENETWNNLDYSRNVIGWMFEIRRCYEEIVAIVKNDPQNIKSLSLWIQGVLNATQSSQTLVEADLKKEHIRNHEVYFGLSSILVLWGKHFWFREDYLLNQFKQEGIEGLMRIKTSKDELGLDLNFWLNWLLKHGVSIDCLKKEWMISAIEMEQNRNGKSKDDLKSRVLGGLMIADKIGLSYEEEFENPNPVIIQREAFQQINSVMKLWEKNITTFNAQLLWGRKITTKNLNANFHKNAWNRQDLLQKLGQELSVEYHLWSEASFDLKCQSFKIMFKEMGYDWNSDGKRTARGKSKRLPFLKGLSRGFHYGSSLKIWNILAQNGLQLHPLDLESWIPSLEYETRRNQGYGSYENSDVGDWFEKINAVAPNGFGRFSHWKGMVQKVSEKHVGVIIEIAKKSGWTPKDFEAMNVTWIHASEFKAWSDFEALKKTVPQNETVGLIKVRL